MRSFLRKLGAEKLLLQHVIQPSQAIRMLLRDTDADIRYLFLQHIQKKRARTLASTPAASLAPNYWGTCELIEIAAKDFPSGHAVWDVGACYGTWAVLAKSLIPHAPLVCIEPLPEHLSKIREKEPLLRPCTIIEAAVGAHSGTVNIHRTNRADSSSVLPLGDAARAAYQLEQTEQFPVTLLTLDEILHRAPHPPALLKLDVQGYELEALKGAQKVLETCRHLIIELSFVELYRGQPLAADIIAWLNQHGFHPIALGAETELAMPLVQADMLFSKLPRTAS